ncbi:spermidine/putrescine transport system ATP-binding protein [Mesorhizobium soli]|uniref:ABC transporter ATP-binding protein n=1 Tax=Pseudaminobacter soli (ex Li et al. 2025) TaxID=1295366 RepID=UPI00247458ED|nr:ABC transporter ATP-binding protein [Mesorhizobium soli]MDH6233880.1 spermidine/putrescine transport system ATP-binding protein [Mesorhizobium soli]
MISRPIVALSGVAKSYSSFIALDTTDLSLGEGEFVTLLGPSGCGKTTTLRLIGGFELADRGRIEIAGEDVTAKPPYRRPVNTVFQEYALFPHMTVAENIGYGLSVKANNVPAAERRRRVTEALAMVGLEEMGMRRTAELSGGQRQRVAMARAIVRRPRVLLLDEPLSALDVKLREGMQMELKRLHRELGITFLMVTHDQQEALALSDRIVVMNRGRIVQIGSPAELYDAPTTPYVADFIGTSNLVPVRSVGSDGQFDHLLMADGTRLRRRRRPGDRVFPNGQSVLAGIRPERLLTSDGGEVNRLAGRIVEALFQGDRVRIEIALAGGYERRSIFANVTRTASTASGAIEPGTEISLQVDPFDIMLFAAEDGQ